MIINKTPLPLAHVQEYVKNVEDTKPISLYLKKFSKLSKTEVDALIANLRALNNLKLREETLVKIADFQPQDTEDLSKILPDVSLTEEESAAILGLIKNPSKGGNS